ncbi:MAG: hypothetical protein ACRD0U_18625 [Acidimicrobiales bacterium]
MILVEKNASFGERSAQVAAVAFVALGLALIARPGTLSSLT